MAFHVSALTKSYGGVSVLKGVNLSVADGEIHALLGANGAGKSTLIKCISGAEQPDSGVITIGDREYGSLNPKTSRQAGIAVIYQVPSVALSLTVAENVYLGIEPRSGLIRRRQAATVGARAVLQSLGSELDPDADLVDLGNADLQLIEIAKALVRDPGVLILDEPTASLTEREVDQLTRQMKRLRDQHLPQLFVTHRLTEALELADRVTVLRGGEVVLSTATAELTRDDLVAAIVGREPSSTSANNATKIGDRPLLTVNELTAKGIGPVDLIVGIGEIVGLYGLVGAGRTELLEALAGASSTVTSGTVKLAGQPLKLNSPRHVNAQGVALVPSDRLRKSIFSSLSASANVLLPSMAKLGQGPLARSSRAERELFSATADQLHLAPNHPGLEAQRFSGGNQQKLVIGRWLNDAGACQLLMLDEPTDGVDVGARSDLYDSVRRFSGQGDRGVLFASSEPEELLRVADRVVVLARGRVAGVLTRNELSEHRLLSLAHAGE